MVDDMLLNKGLEIMRKNNIVSISMLQRALGISFIEAMELLNAIKDWHRRVKQ